MPLAMRSLPLLIALLMIAGCASSSAQTKAVASSGNVIEVGQPWADAKGVATRANYQFRDQDVIGVEWLPQPAGFILRLNDDFDLFVIRDATSTSVKDLRLVSNSSKPKKWRGNIDLPAFILPAAPADRN